MSTVNDQAIKDIEGFHALAQEAEKAGEPVLAGIYRVEAGNVLDRMHMRKVHMPNLGPYTADNPKHCLHCGTTTDDFVTGTCVPSSP